MKTMRQKQHNLQFLFSVCSECSRLFHKGGARLILCGTSWDKLESLYDSLTNDADPKEVRKPNSHKAAGLLI